MKLHTGLRIYLLLALIAVMAFAFAGCDQLEGIIDTHEHVLVDHEGKAPTCESAGYKPYQTCSECDSYTTYTALDPLGHDYSDECVADGDVHTRACTRCTSVLTSAHSWGNPVVAAPTCTLSGVSYCFCSDCGAEKWVYASMFGHKYEEAILPDGTQGLVCSVCSASVSVHAHDWQTTAVITAPTCTDSGSEEQTCSVCMMKKTVTTAALGHAFVDEYVPNGDVHSIFCSNCSATIGNHPHTWESLGVTKEPSCTETGEEHFVCNVCNAEKTVELPKAHGARGSVVITQPGALTAGLKSIVCMDCHEEIATERIAPDVESMPIMYLTGNYEGAYVNGAKAEVAMTVTYVEPDGTSFNSYATIKAQGSSSIGYAKKNYTIKFFNDAAHGSKNKIDLGWGKQNKYVMKANWVDYTQSRNVMSCRLWGDIVQTRKASLNQQKLASLLTNGGAVDGYPIAVYMNGSFHGLYTMNVPKDEWMFGMGEKGENGKKSTTEALIASDDWNHTDFYSTIGEFVEDSAGDLIAKDGGWELIYHGGDDHAWVAKSFDALITFCQNNDGDAFKNGIAQHLDVDAAIDYLIYMYANCMHDNASKNMLWATYDGKTWIPSVYDQDGTFGQVWDGVRFARPTSSLPSVKNNRIDVGINYGPNTGHTPMFILWDRLWNSFTAEILARYDELRVTVLSTEYMIAEYEKFEAMIPESMYAAEWSVWADARTSWWAGKSNVAPSPTYDYNAYHYDYIYNWIEDRMIAYDTAIANIRNYYGL